MRGVKSAVFDKDCPDKMDVRLRVSAGPSLDRMVPVDSSVNTGIPHEIKSEVFEGKVAGYIKDYVDEDGNTRESEYFSREDRRGTTWSLQVQGRFLQPYSADDILFATVVDGPIQFPMGTELVLNFIQLIDPALDYNFTSPTPWISSPMIVSAPHIAHRRMDTPSSTVQHSAGLENRMETFPSKESIQDQTLELCKALRDSPSSSSVPPEMCFNNVAARKAFFSDRAHRQEFVFGPSDVFTIDFCYGFLEFWPKLVLRIPGGISFDLMQYWKGQRVMFVCYERKKDQSADDQWPCGDVFWAVSIELYEATNKID